MTVWRESTTTCPSGMHFGHHKALFKEFPVSDKNSPRELQTTESKLQPLLKGQLDLLNCAIKHSYCYERWKKVATFMIRQYSSRSHRLRVIRLYEADLNLLLGVKWRSLTHRCIDNALLNTTRFWWSRYLSQNYNGKQLEQSQVLGHMFHGTRHEYAVLGSPVNLAARLMATKDNNGILVDEAVKMSKWIFFVHW
jgi:hypothetical protein